MVRMDEESIGWMEDFLSKFSDPIELIFNLLPRALVTAKNCLELLWHSRFVSGKFDADCFAASL